MWRDYNVYSDFPIFNSLLSPSISRASIDSDLNDKHVTFANQQVQPQPLPSKNNSNHASPNEQRANFSNQHPQSQHYSQKSFMQRNNSNNIANEFTEPSYYQNKYKKLSDFDDESLDDNSQLVIHKYDRSPNASTQNFNDHLKMMQRSKTALTLVSTSSRSDSRRNSTSSLGSVTTNEPGSIEEIATTERYIENYLSSFFE